MKNNKGIIIVAFIVIPIVVTALLSGYNSNEDNYDESDYKSAIYEHMKQEHNANIGTYKLFKVYDGGGAHAIITITKRLYDDGIIDLSNEIELSEYLTVRSCLWCDLGR